MTSSDNDFELALNAAYLPSGLVPSRVELEKESAEYGALTFGLMGHNIKFRVGKVTPTKLGHFVTIWKREEGITKPPHHADPIDFIVISVRDDSGFGQFIFDKATLIKQGLMSTDKKEGKRGFRLYPPWVKALSAQAKKTQQWQGNYFIQFNESETKVYPALSAFFSQ
jgi:hypothetical protein